MEVVKLTIQQFIKHCMTTPENLNPRVLKSMIQELMEKGESFARVGNESYATLADAVEGAAADAVLTICDDIQQEERIQVNKNLTIDLNGKTISSKGIVFQVVDDAVLTINGGKDGSKIEGNLVVGNSKGANGTLIINGGEFTNTVVGDAMIQTHGMSKNCSVTIKDAKISSLDDTFYLPGDGKCIIENCEIEGYTGIYAKSGDIEIINCKISANGPFSEPIPNGNGANSTGDAIILDSKKGYAGNIKLTLKGNNVFTSKNGYAIHEALTDVTDSATVSLIIEDGQYTGKKGAIESSEAFDKAVEEGKAICEISGGIYSSKVKDLYLAEGKVCSSLGQKFIVE